MTSSLQRRLQERLQDTISSARLAPYKLSSQNGQAHVDLLLLADDFPRGPLPHDEMLAILREPAYWAFCWASGQVLASYLLQNPELSRGKTVLDFGAGSGVVGIAAALAGAKKVICCDIDPVALQACEANASLNGVEVVLLEDINLLEDKLDWLIAADVLYDRENFPWIKNLLNLAPEVLIADSRVKKERLEGYEVVDRITATTIPDLDEFKEFSDVRIYRSR